MTVFEAYEQYRAATLQRLGTQSAAVARQAQRRDALLIVLSVVTGMALFGGGMLLARHLPPQATCPQVAPRA